jgi:polyribonucleotide nucleotidyltransferase
MDFKIAGTQNGITGIQLDLKTNGISEEIIRATLAQSREARIEILRAMLSTMPRPREATSPTAPRLVRTHINPEKIGLLIGPGGKNIRGIQEDCGVTIDVEEDGTVTIAGPDEDSVRAGLNRVDGVTASVQVGRIYNGKVTSVKDFGAFVEILPGKDGLCHISELSNEYVSSVADVCKVGDRMEVKVIAVDEQDRVKLSRRAAMAEAAEATADAAPAE